MYNPLSKAMYKNNRFRRSWILKINEVPVKNKITQTRLSGEFPVCARRALHTGDTNLLSRKERISVCGSREGDARSCQIHPSLSYVKIPSSVYTFNCNLG